MTTLETIDPARREAWLAALADDCLAEEAYPVIMERGRQILASGAIQRPELQFPADGEVALLATIVGTAPYQVGVMLSGSGRGVSLEASCTCPHAGDGFFCKHQVALALFLRAGLGGEDVAVEPAAAMRHAATLKRAATAAAKTASLRDFLAARPADELAERLMQFAAADADLKRDLLAWQATADAASDPKSLSKLITQLLPQHDFLDWSASNAYARRAAQVLPVLQDALKAQAPAEALKLVERAYLRLQKQLESSDDSGGQLGDVCAQVGRLWLQALQQAGPQPAAFGERYAELRDAEVVDFVPHDAAVAAMGPAAAKRYGERLRADWESALAAAQARPADARSAVSSSDSGLWRPRHRYLSHLAATGDAEERLRVLRAALDTEGDHLALLEELDHQGRAREALDCAERAHRLFPRSHSIEAALLARYARDGWDAEALAVRRARFDREPDARHALAVLEAARQAKVAAEPLRDQMWQALIAAEAAQQQRPQPGFGFMRQQGTPARNVGERLAWLMAEGRLDEALALAQPPHTASPALLEALACGLPPGQNAAAAALLRRAFGFHMPGASSPYTNELRLVRLVVSRLPAGEATAWLAALRDEYRAKRNFIRGLP